MNDMVFCRACGHKIHITANACPQCGAIQRKPAQEPRGDGAAGVLPGRRRPPLYLGQWWGSLPAAVLDGGAWPGRSDRGHRLPGPGQQSFDEAYNDGVDSGGSGASAAIIAVVAVVGGIFLIGVLAAIALPAYQEYTHKAKLQSAQLWTGADRPDRGLRRDAPPRAGWRVELPSPGRRPAGWRGRRSTRARVSWSAAWRIGWRARLHPEVASERAADGRIGWQCHSEDIPASWLPKACR